jgi:hypothetical protein
MGQVLKFPTITTEETSQDEALFDLGTLVQMLGCSIEEVANEATLDLFVNRFEACLDKLEATQDTELRRHIVGEALRHMFMLGRWSVLS